MSQQTNIAARTAFAQAVSDGRLDAFEQIVARGSFDHDPGPGQMPGPDRYDALFGALRAAFPDLHVAVDHLMAAGDELAFACTIIGTHRGQLMGQPPTGKTVSYRDVQTNRFDSNGKLIERWGRSDGGGMLRRLGLAEM
ncbi:ester cyclase [Streptomyces sp. NBC_00557]|uniref:ester cyclase n=1 Tax=Streptomyces sp. NBC_00557 TaxID=2975776 RepID=UPI002E8170C6|nr:ester cyclase [Streptomyces sp. NBC_00557]WUC39305.1 ester cyclase [Streptomyces sp. NBC_00557]